LSNQLNHWLSQISNDFDIDFNYRPGDNITSNQVEMALSTQFFNDRVNVEINGNMGLGNAQTSAPKSGFNNNLVGDVNVDFKITESGKFRVKYSARANDPMIEDDPYTQGVGIFYREEFDSFVELLKGYLAKIRKKEEPKQ